MNQYYTFINNPPFDLTNILNLELKEAIEINPSYYVVPNEGVLADNLLPMIQEGEVYIVSFEREAKDLTVSQNVKVVKDYRGLTVWEKSTAQETEWNKVFLDDEYTEIKPSFDYAKWQDSGWIEDTEQKNAALLILANQEFNARLTEANSAINPLQDAVDLDIATEEEGNQLKAWKKYRVLLNRVKSQEGWPVSIEWPEKV